MEIPNSGSKKEEKSSVADDGKKPHRRRHKKDLAEKRQAKILFLRSMFSSFDPEVIDSILAGNDDVVEDATTELLALSQPQKRPEPRWCLILSAITKPVVCHLHLLYLKFIHL